MHAIQLYIRAAVSGDSKFARDSLSGNWGLPEVTRVNNSAEGILPYPSVLS
jgi:hypothetical protein